MPCSLTPAGWSVKPFGVTTVAFRDCNAVGPCHQQYFEAQSHGLGLRCLRFAAPVTRTPRKTRYRTVASLIRAGLSPAGLQLEVSGMSAHAILLHQAEPGALHNSAYKLNIER